MSGPTPAVVEAREILTARQGDPAHLFTLAQQLKDQHHFAYARQLLALARELENAPAGQGNPKYVTEQALCTYKDPELPTELRLEEGLAVLAAVADPSSESRGIEGAIHKAKWEWDGQVPHLFESLEKYRAGIALELKEERGGQGYCAINAAFVLDILGCLEQDQDKQAQARRDEADTLRRELLAPLRARMADPHDPASDPASEDAWWVGVTLLEALLGLGDVDGAREVLQRLPPVRSIEGWRVETTVRQLVARARLRHGSESQEFHDAMGFLRDWLEDYAPGIDFMRVGKLGLALSGGGFRASFFHLGVLAYLADRDLLRHVQVLSCVSGGSIAGAQYYLRLRDLLHATPDEEITRDDYRQVVATVIEDFREGVGANIRGRLLSSVRQNVELLRTRGRSRTERLADLLDEKLIFRVTGRTACPMRELYVTPTEGFSMRSDNWRRCAKVPVLVLNATTLNTGHVWQFTASTIGEPAFPLSADVDMNSVLRRAWYDDVEAPWDRFPVAKAVAASACVPGLFAPLDVGKLYKGFDAKLVDGGVHDNQGVASLFEQDCTAVIVSDASGQMQDAGNPSGWVPKVLGRSSSITMARVRGSQYDAVDARADAGVIRNRLIVHLRSGLRRRVVTAGDEIADPLLDRTGAGGKLTFYGVDREVQMALAQLRTDLDAFSDAEAYALMESGYRQMKTSAPAALTDFPFRGEEGPWEFRGVGEALEKPDEHFLRVLAVGARLFFKVPALLGWTLGKVLRAVLLLALAVGALFLAAAAGGVLDDVVSVVRWLLLGMLAVVVAAVVLLPITLAVGAQVQLRWLDPYFRRWGATDRIPGWPGL